MGTGRGEQEGDRARAGRQRAPEAMLIGVKLKNCTNHTVKTSIFVSKYAIEKMKTKLVVTENIPKSYIQ